MWCQACGVFSNRVSPSTSEGWPRTVVIACNLGVESIGAHGPKAQEKVTHSWLWVFYLIPWDIWGCCPFPLPLPVTRWLCLNLLYVYMYILGSLYKDLQCYPSLSTLASHVPTQLVFLFPLFPFLPSFHHCSSPLPWNLAPFMSPYCFLPSVGTAV